MCSRSMRARNWRLRYMPSWPVARIFRGKHLPIGAKTMPKTRVLLADDHAVVAQGLEALLKDVFELVGVVHDGRALVEAAETLKPDVIVTDISMPLLNGIDAIRQIRAR